MPEPPPPPAPHPHRGGSSADSVVENGSSSSTPNQMPAVSPSHVLGHLHSPQYTPGEVWVWAARDTQIFVTAVRNFQDTSDNYLAEVYS